MDWKPAKTIENQPKSAVFLTGFCAYQFFSFRNWFYKTKIVLEMTHEFISIIEQAQNDKSRGVGNVLATVVALDGSSYRKPGVRMLLSEDGKMTGAVSGGCVEKEVQRRAASVFKDNQPKIMTYDGRYRLGCEGILYILLEPFEPSAEGILHIHACIQSREPFTIKSYYKKEDESSGPFGSVFCAKKTNNMAFRPDFKWNEALLIFEQTMQPVFKLVIIGGEHDAVKLCAMASLLGWQVEVITSVNDPKVLEDFPGAHSVSAQTAEHFSLENLDLQAAVILMTHNYAQDLRFLLRLQNTEVGYLGILGSSNRRENPPK